MKPRTKEGDIIYNLNSYQFSKTEFKHDRGTQNGKVNRKAKNHCTVEPDVEIIQEFNMPDVCTSIEVTDDEDFILVAGLYTPRIKCFDVNNISMKFERCMNYEIIKFVSTSKSFHNMALLHNNKQLELHNKRGKQHILPIPSYGRDLTYLHNAQVLLVVGASPEMFGVNFERGEIITTVKSKSREVNACTVDTDQNIFITGSSEGLIEFWDPRIDSITNCIQSLNNSPGCELTCLSYFDPNLLGIGTSQGEVIIFDQRHWNAPIISRKNNKINPINRISCGKRSDDKCNIIMSSNESVVEMWCQDTGEAFCDIEPSSKVNDFVLIPNSGLLCVASDCSNIQSYFVPDIGCSPRWCKGLNCVVSEVDQLN